METVLNQNEKGRLDGNWTINLSQRYVPTSDIGLLDAEELILGELQLWFLTTSQRA
jgi:hypothetical protein